MTPPINVTRDYALTAEQVFDAWLDPHVAGRFLFATPDGVMTRVEIDPRVGGKFCIVERRGETDAEHVGTYTAIERPRSLTFRFGDNLAFDATMVTIEIEPLAEGGCRLTLTHEGVLEEWRDQTVKGWTLGPADYIDIRLYYQDALSAGKYRRDYANTNPDEYFAEATQAYFLSTDPEGRRDREWLESYDPAIFALVARTYGD